jgi:hypothetical protein
MSGWRNTIDKILARKFVDENDCWIWQGAKNKGYGLVMYQRRHWRVHRLLYEAAKGAVPPGYHLDHLCRNPSCVNPDHLEAVTARENILRGVGASARNAKKTHCPQGHPLADGYVNSRGSRECRPCRKSAYQRWKARASGTA